MVGLHKATVPELREIRKQGKLGKTQVVFVNRRDYFSPPKDVIAKFKDLYRRFKDRDRRIEYAVNGSKYEELYRLKLTRSSKAISRMKKMAKDGRTMDIYLVVEDKTTPDADIIIDIIRKQVNLTDYFFIYYI